MLESPVLIPIPSAEHESQSSNMASPVQFIKEYIEKTLNTPPGFPISVAAEHYKRQRLIEEIVESEIEYVQMLKILQNCFLDVLTINDYIPMEALNKVVTKILPQHESFSAALNSLVEGSVKRFDESTELNWSDLSLTSWDHLDLCENVGRLLANQALQKDEYRSYVQSYNQVSHLLTRMGQESQDRLLFAILFRIELCLPKYYSRTSQQGYKRDFSFRAMIQMPINRIAKYRLFLESLVYLTENPSITDVRRLDHTECDKLTQNIKDYLHDIFEFLQQINEAHVESSKDSALTLIQSRLAFDLPEERIPIEAMGPCYSKGCLAVAWPSAEETSYTIGSYRRTRYFNNFYKTKRSLKIESDQLGVFLFKSYLVLAEIPSYREKTSINEWPIKFALRLSNCRLIDDMNSQMGSKTEDIGMFSNYDNTIKIQFDYDFKLWEILLFCRDAEEFHNWRKELDLFINNVHAIGDDSKEPSRHESVSQSTLESTLHFSDSTTFPDQMVPFISYNESLSGRFDRTRSFKRRVNNWAGQCYNGEIAKVEVDFRNSLMEISPASTWFLRGSSSRVDLRPETSRSSLMGPVATFGKTEDRTPPRTCSGIETDSWAFNVVFTKWKRVQVERGMWDVWSSHLEKLSGFDDEMALSQDNMGPYTSTVDTPRTEALVRASSENVITTNGGSSPVRASTFRSTRWSIKRVFSRRRGKKV
ncbi:LANO_0B05204g1_1 [Lachancea nothofagi CBS 11611]|uniref:LANO_0B05204g1_1 n=1 Tax=Lachancea nothofagi CBS 11611 TaxID=1266666 RepID=A0A1G4IYU2_9SACH|nr:LANO_0B05204g1_1 [Lachancea nothofagi CBS 11611]